MEGSKMKKNMRHFVDKGITNGSLKIIEAFKVTKVSVKRGSIGEEVTTWGTDKEGNPIIKRKNKVKIDPKTNKTDYILTQLNHKGSVILDENNNPRQWIVEESFFLESFEQNDRNPIIYEYKSPTEKFVKSNRNITVLNHNQPIQIGKGDYINVTDPINMYVIQKEEFESNYRLEEKEKEKQYTKKHNYSA